MTASELHSIWPSSGLLLCCQGRRMFTANMRAVCSSFVYALYGAVAVLTIGPGYTMCEPVLGSFWCGVSAVLPSIALLALLSVISADPGVLPRSLASLAPAFGTVTKVEAKDLGNRLSRGYRAMEKLGIQIAVGWPEIVHLPHHHAHERGQEYGELHQNLDPARFCRTCLTLHPKDCHHCSTTDACVAGFDHYCGVVGKAIARGNHRMFIVFVAATGFGTGIIGVVYGILGWHILEAEIASAGDALADPTRLVASVSAIVMWSVAALSCLCCICSCGSSGGVSAVVYLPIVAGCALGALATVIPGVLNAVLPCSMALGLGPVSIPLIGFSIFNLHLICTNDSTKARIRRKKEMEAEMTSLRQRHLAREQTEEADKKKSKHTPETETAAAKKLTDSAVRITASNPLPEAAAISGQGGGGGVLAASGAAAIRPASELIVSGVAAPERLKHVGGHIKVPHREQGRRVALPVAPEATHDALSEVASPIVRWLCACFLLQPCCGGCFDPCKSSREVLTLWEPQSASAFCARGWGLGRRINWTARVAQRDAETEFRRLQDAVNACGSCLDQPASFCRVELTPEAVEILSGLFVTSSMPTDDEIASRISTEDASVDDPSATLRQHRPKPTTLASGTVSGGSLLAFPDLVVVRMPTTKEQENDAAIV